MKTLKEKIEVMQAALDGKEIEYRFTNRNNWEIVSNELHEFNWADYDYRIKPEPSEFWVNVYPVHSGKAYYLSEDGSCSEGCIKTIKVREVTE